MEFAARRFHIHNRHLSLEPRETALSRSLSLSLAVPRRPLLQTLLAPGRLPVGSRLEEEEVLYSTLLYCVVCVGSLSRWQPPAPAPAPPPAGKNRGKEREREIPLFLSFSLSLFLSLSLSFSLSSSTSCSTSSSCSSAGESDR